MNTVILVDRFCSTLNKHFSNLHFGIWISSTQTFECTMYINYLNCEKNKYTCIDFDVDKHILSYTIYMYMYILLICKQIVIY